MRLPAPAAYATSAALHLLALAGLAGMPALSPMETVAVEFVDVAAPVPAPADAAPEPPPPSPAPEPVAAPRRPQPRRVAPPPRDAPRPDPQRAPDPSPPPPNAEPPEDAPPPRRAPVRVGVSMSGSTAGGTFSAPAGNTLYGEMPKSAPNPEEVTPYQSEHYVPPTQVTVLPRVRCGRLPRSEYPEEARLAEIEGRVVLKLLVDETGRIAEATVVEEPGHGLGAATVATLKRHCRADAARRGNTKVATEVRYTFRWELE